MPLTESDIEVIEDKVELGVRRYFDHYLEEILPLQPGDVDQTFADISKAKKLLGYNPKTNFIDGIDKFVEWLKDN